MNRRYMYVLLSLLAGLSCAAMNKKAESSPKLDRFKVKEVETTADKIDIAECIDLCGTWGIQVKGGIAPIVWTDRDFSTSVNCNGLVPTINNLCKVGKFSEFFNQPPWTVGVEVDYYLNDCFSIYGDFQYRQAKGKLACTPVVTCSGAAPIIKFGHYKSYSLYFGNDYHTGPFWCDRVSFFLGIKIGFTRFGNFNAAVLEPVTPTTALLNSCCGESCSVVNSSPCNNPCESHQTVFSGGARLGFDWCLPCNFTFVFTAEFLGQAGPQLSRITAPSIPGVNQFRFGDVGTEVVFPIQFGLHYSF